MLSLSKAQEGSLAYDVVRRHAKAQSRDVDGRMRHRDVPSTGSEDQQRLLALRQVLEADLARRAPAAAPHLRVDLGLCAAQLNRALEVGAAYRESAASAQMLGCASLGLLWLSDERLCTDRTALPPLEAHDATAMKRWAEAGWADRFARALARMQAVQTAGIYALDRAVAARFDPAALRNLADTVFPVDQHRLARFVHVERQLFQGALRSGPGPVDPRLEPLCIAADLVHGLGRFVRLAAALRQQVPAVEYPYPHLVKAIGELAG